MSASKHRLRAICLPARFTVFTGVTDVLNRLEPGTLANFITLDSFTNLDNNAGPLMACALRSQFGHFGEIPVVKHKMNITEAEAGGIEFNQHIVGA